MKKFVAIVLSVVASTAIAQSNTKVLQKISRHTTAHSQAYIALEEACRTIGHRLTGSPNGEKAEQYAYDFLKKSGLKNVRFQPFEVQSWSRGSVSLGIGTINTDIFTELPTATLAHSPAQADVTAPIIDLGDGLAEEFQSAADAVKGKIVLMNIGLTNRTESRKNLHRSEKTALAIQHGAVGVIMINNAPGKILLTGTASVTGKTIPIPAVSITNDDGARLREELKKQPLAARIQMTNQIGVIKARNVIGTIVGSDPAAGKIVIGGHLDSWDLATGASDNGIGSFAILDVARTFAALKLKPKRTIEFVMFMGEEQGLLGSRQYVQQAIADSSIGQIALMINVDMTSNPIGFSVPGQAQAETFYKAIGEKIRAIDNRFTNTFSSAAGLHSDHQPFMLQGVPVMSFVGSLPAKALNCYHADCDNIDLVDAQALKNTVRLMSMALYELANAPTLPLQKMDDEAVKNFLIANGLKEPLVISGDWRWGK
ncbi:MAG: M20/M25/M40 family metallo-hydrolase [Cytophagales bacterium]|nr:M20/M25/M40 family metallo-hydrolase [Bernardetiaceae bacterium]MDW8205139.1 M20/M25/M40 family metallo-hydrolase [Cytophagales bacterium]